MADSNFPLQLKLVRQRNGLYTLIANTTSPDSCHFATRPIPGAVPGQPVPVDLIPILLPLVSPASPQACLPTPTHLTHRIGNIRIGKNLRKKGVKVFLVINPGLGLIDTATIRV